MDRSTLEWYEMLARGLIWLAGIVMILAVVGAVVIAGSHDSLGLLSENVESQGRGVAALASLGGGLAAAGLLGGLGAILRLLVADRMQLLAAEPEEPAKRSPRPARPPKPAAPKPKRPKAEEPRPRARGKRSASEPKPDERELG